MAHGEPHQRERDDGADRFDQRLRAARSLEQKPHDRHQPDENGEAGELPPPELRGRRLQERRVAIGERFPVEGGEDDGDEVAERREDERGRVALGFLEITGRREPDEKADVHAGVVPEKRALAPRIVRGEALGEHHVDARHVEPAAGEKQGEPDVEERRCAARDAAQPNDLQRHAADEKVAVGKKAPAEVAAEEVQPVVERAEDAHERRRLLRAELQVLRRVEHQRRVEHRETERRENLDKEQRGRSFRSRGEPALEKIHPVGHFARQPRQSQADGAGPPSGRSVLLPG